MFEWIDLEIENYNDFGKISEKSKQYLLISYDLRLFMVNPIKIGGGTATVLLGLYLINLNSLNIPYVIVGIILIGFGIGIMASDK